MGEVEPEPPTPPPRRAWLRRIALALAGLAALALAAVGGGYVWLGSDSGRSFVARQIAALQFQTGMKIGIGRIDGSLFGAMHIRDFTVSDPKGVWLAAPEVALDWRPFAYARKRVDVRALTIPSARLYRLPAFNPTPPSNAPLLPDLDIDIGQLQLGRLQIDPPVTGRRHLVHFAGSAHIADRRAQISANARALIGPGIAGGDRLALRLDAVPERNRLDIDLHLVAPAEGLVASYSNVHQPLDLRLGGAGDWRSWSGRLRGTTGNGQLADVAIIARDGTFMVQGPTRPGLFLSGPGRDMLEPVTNVALTATARQRRVQLDGDLRSDNFQLDAKGEVDLGTNQMHGLQLAFRLLKPSVIAKNLSGADVAANATLDGSFIAPHVRYGATARRIAFGATSVDGLSIAGSAALDDQQWRIPVHGTARRILGMNASVAPLLTNVRLDGALAYANGRLLSDNLRLRSDRIDATAVVVADLNKALYTGALKGRVNDYLVESVGVFNVQTNADLKTGANGYFKLAGHVNARSTRLFNDGVRAFLGGNALIAADVGYDSNGMASVDRLNVAAPAFRLTGGSGRYAANGAIRFNAHGNSNRYGPLDVQVGGSVARPVAHVLAARPGMGVGLANVEATIRGTGKAYAVIAKGETDYGPFAADAVIATGPVRADLKPGTRFAGVGLTGHVAQTAAGPFAGTLNASGSGISGQVALSSFAGKQRAVIDATARDASLPGRTGLTIGRALINADVVLYDQPQVRGSIQLAGTRTGELYIAAARADVTYRDGQGQARALIEGRQLYPFRIAANAALQPDLWRVALRGRVNGVDLATRGALRIVPDKRGYTLQPGTIDTGQGNLEIAGRYGPGITLQTRLNAVNLALANAFAPTLGLGGMASGSLDFSQPNADAFPSADARLKIDSFTRTTLAAVSQPVDLAVTGRLVPDGGALRAIIRRRGAAVGQLQLDLRPLPPGAGSWTTRLMAAPLAGGIRYNGPADTLFSLAALPDQSLKGPIDLAADFSGRARAPQLTGVVRANKLVYENAHYGTRLTDMQVSGRFTNERLQVEKLTAKAGDGTISASGFVSLSSDQGFPIQLGIDMNRAQLARGQDLAAAASGQIRLVNGPGQEPTITGKVDLPETRYRIVRQGSAKVTTLTGIRRIPATGGERITGNAEALRSVPSTWKLDVQVTADNKIYVSGMGLDSEWAANIHVGGTSGAPVITGGIDLVRGNLGFAGRSFELQQGRIRFNGGAVSNPELTIVASGDVEDVTINITIGGTAQDPQISFSSTPSLPQDELMARILFGSSVGQLTATQALQLAASLNTLRGGKGGLNPLGVLQSASGIDRLRILGGDKQSGRGTSLAVGQYISNNIYVEIITDARGYTATQLEVTLSKALSVLSQAGSFGSSSVNFRYRKNY